MTIRRALLGIILPFYLVAPLSVFSEEAWKPTKEESFENTPDYSDSSKPVSFGRDPAIEHDKVTGQIIESGSTGGLCRITVFIKTAAGTTVPATATLCDCYGDDPFQPIAVPPACVPKSALPAPGDPPSGTFDFVLEYDKEKPDQLRKVISCKLKKI